MQAKRKNHDPVGETAFRAAPFGMAIIDSTSGEIHEANAAYGSILGRECCAIAGTRWMDYTYLDDLKGDFDCIASLYRNPERSAVRDKRYVMPDGTVCPVRITLAILPPRDGRPTHLAMATTQANFDQKILAIERREFRADLLKLQESFFTAMAIVSEFRNRETGEHLLRTKAFVRLLLENLPYATPFSARAVGLIANSAMLHDIGKIGIPDNVLLKPDRLTPDEFEIMKTHTTLGGDAIRETRKHTSNGSTFMFAEEIAESHHERWDGTGYPRGLGGNDIPLVARIMAIADVYDALRSERSYKDPFCHEEATRIIRESAGTHFDPELVKVFLRLEKSFEKIVALEKKRLNEFATSSLQDSPSV